MTITAKVIADSINVIGNRITTLQLRYPRFIHAEFMTHRMFSRNASSSRAIPVERLIKDIIDDTAMPIHWGKNQKGMQADVEHDAEVKWTSEEEFYSAFVSREEAWFWARDKAIQAARAYARSGYHKQIVNRLLEPFAHINVVVTATEWENFFQLRDHADAQPEIRLLAQAIRKAMDASQPKPLVRGEWHLPYVMPEDHVALQGFHQHSRRDGVMEDLKRVSAARCARVSYMTHDGRRPPFEEDLELFVRLAGSDPKHLSPLEHQAEALDSPSMIRNFRGWSQFRVEAERLV